MPRFSKTSLARPAYNDRVWPEGCRGIVFFGGQRVGPGGARIVNRTQCGHPAIARNGHCTFIAPHLGRTMATILLGRSVETDGIGPGDGTVNLEDNELRAEDGTNLCYVSDRATPERCIIPLFGIAHVDILREVFYRALYEAVEGTGKSAYGTWRWQNNWQATSTVSIDCDSEDNDHVMDVHRSLENHGQRASWLVSSPGFSSDVYRRIKGWGDSIGLLYKLGDPEKASEAIRHQSLQITRAAGVTNLEVVRQNEGRWKGLTIPYALADQIGAGLSVGKGGVQSGSTGFLFGGTVPFFPVLQDGSRSKVAELPYTICRPGIVTEASACQSLINEVSRIGGCIHTSLCLSQSSEQEFGLIDVLRRTKEAKFGMYSPEEILHYERARRSLHVDATQGNLRISSCLDVKGLTLLIFGGGHEAITCNRRYPSVAVRRHGTLVSAFVLNLEARTPTALRFERTRVA